MRRLFGGIVLGFLALVAVGYTLNDGVLVNGSSFFNGKAVVNDSTRLNNYLLLRNGLRLEDPAAGGANYVAFAAPASPTTHTLTFPGTNGSGTLINNGSGTLSWGSAVGDTTGLAYLPGRDGGNVAQVLVGCSNTSATPGTKYVALRGFNNAAAAYIKVSDGIDMFTSTAITWASTANKIALNMLAANDSSASTFYKGKWVFKSGNSSPSDVLAVIGVSGSASAVMFAIKGHSSQTGNLTEWRNSSDTVLASVSSAGVISAAGVASTDSLRANSGLQVGGQQMTKILTGTFTLDVGSVTLASSRDETTTVTGLNSAANWVCFVSPLSAALNTGLGIAYARVSADNTLQIRFDNVTLGNIDPASQTFSYWCVRQ